MPSLRVAVLISGGGTTLRNLIENVASDGLPIEIRHVISSNPNARGLRYAEDAGIAASVVERNLHDTPESFRDAIFSICRSAGVQVVVMGGFLKHVLIPKDFELRVINIHPSLIPAFCGRGFYGLRVHRSVLEYGAKVSGCTVHFVDDEYDHGPIILQRPVAVQDDDAPEDLQKRVFDQECVALPEALRLLATKAVTLRGRQVVIR